ncbi:hypothetical protein [Asticcacaulis sp. MM231]|uniref:hypothetical protein n=1 Tax=Asticcacaulis sp. MM231 TaxID=3157666 RepID=UPI0032D59AB6
MTKDGRPSRLNDIRLFAGSYHTDLKGFEEQVAFGRRLAWAVNAEGVSVGAHTALYVYFAPSIGDGEVMVTSRGGEWWQRYVDVGVPAEFPGVDATDRIEKGIVDAVCASAPQKTDLIRQTAAIVSREGDRLRFLQKRRNTRKYIVEVTSTIVAWPAASLLFVSLTEKATGKYFEAPPATVSFYDDARRLSGAIKITNIGATVEPKTSVAAQVASLHQGGDLCWAIDDFQPATRPVVIDGLSLR